MISVSLNKTQYLELEKLALGAFSPLTGFMTEDDFHGAVERMRLSDGSVFPLPIVLDLSPHQAEAVRGEREIALSHGGLTVGSMRVESRFSFDKAATAARVFGTTDGRHPGVAALFDMGEVCVGGPVRLTVRPSFDISRYETTPAETRALFAARGWKTTAGFQTRNVPHRAHEYLQRTALEHVDGLFIQPLVGRKKRGDYTPEAILRGYEALLAGFYPPERVVLGILSTAMRYAGPREAVFHALVRRNYGCTHFIVGRDHAGVGSYYGKYDAHRLIETVADDLGIEIMRLHGPYHCEICDGIATEHTCPHHLTAPERTRQISGTDMRALLAGEQRPDPRLMRPEIIAALQGVPLFIEDNE